MSLTPGSQEFTAMEELVAGSEVAVVGSLDDRGFPNAKQMFTVDREGLKTFWFSTNTSSLRVGQFQNDPRACLYFTGALDGLMLVGTMEVRGDRASRERLWDEASLTYYPQGIDDPDYSVLRFTAAEGRYYRALRTYTFSVPAES